jgi:hypothetical protein
LVFGLLFALLSGSSIDELYNYNNCYGIYQVAIAYSQLVGLILAAAGAGFLTYGYGVNLKSPLQSQ